MDKEMDLPIELQKSPAEYFQIALDLMKEVTGVDMTSDQEAKMLVELGRVWDLAGNLSKAIEKYYEALNKCQSDDLRAEILKQIGNIKSKQSKWDEALRSYEDSLVILKKLGDNLKIGDIYNNIGFNYFETGKFTNAKECYDQALDFAKKSKNKRLLGDVLNNIGILMNAIGDKEGAIEHYKQSIEIYNAISDNHGLAQTYHNIALTYTELGKLELAGEFYQKSLKLCIEICDLNLLPVIYINRAKLALKVHDVYMAKNYCDKAHLIFEKTGNQIGLAESYKTYGILFSSIHEWRDADNAFREGIEICESCNNSLTKAEIYYEMAKSFLIRGDKESTLKHMERAIDIYESIGVHEEASKIRSEIDTIIKETV